jgi:hypothetical protein
MSGMTGRPGDDENQVCCVVSASSALFRGRDLLLVFWQLIFEMAAERRVVAVATFFSFSESLR